jgi:hypothetical protein
VKKAKIFLLRSGTRKEYLPLYSFNIMLKFLAIVIRQEKEVRGIQIEKEEVK